MAQKEGTLPVWRRRLVITSTLQLMVLECWSRRPWKRSACFHDVMLVPGKRMNVAAELYG